MENSILMEQELTGIENDIDALQWELGTNDNPYLREKYNSLIKEWAYLVNLTDILEMKIQQ